MGAAVAAGWVMVGGTKRAQRRCSGGPLERSGAQEARVH